MHLHFLYVFYRKKKKKKKIWRSAFLSEQWQILSLDRSGCVGKKLQNLAHVLLSKPFVLLTICQCCKVITWLRYIDSQPSWINTMLPHPELLKTQFKRNSQVHFHMLKWAVINNLYLNRRRFVPDLPVYLSIYLSN